VAQWRFALWFVLWILLPASAAARAQQAAAGSIRGSVIDKDFNAPLAGVQVLNLDTGERVLSGDQGNFVFGQVAPGQYTLVFSKDGYVRQVRSGVVVNSGALTDLSVELVGEFTDMDEFVVQDLLQASGGTEAGLLQLRFESPSLLDSISSDIMSRAGAGDAASALRLVSGATVQDDNSAVIRGLPDRYVSSQLNGVRLPTANEDKRAVELDQFPSAVIESIQVSKTFTPDQQGDASGGAVDVRLKGIPDKSIFQIKAQIGANSQVTGKSDFLSYSGGGFGFWGDDAGDDDKAQQLDLLNQDWEGAVGVSPEDGPLEYKWSLAAGGKHELAGGWTLGGLASFFYERDSSHYRDATNDSWWIESPGAGMTPQQKQGTASDGNFKTALFDQQESTDSVQWGGLGLVGLESEEHSFQLTYLYTRTTEDKAILAEDTRGKEFYFPGYDPNNPTGIGNDPDSLQSAPYLRLETLEYTERSTGSLQFSGEHQLPFEEREFGSFTFRQPKLDWGIAQSFAELVQPDKRQFGALWHPDSFSPGVPPFVPPSTTPATWFPLPPSDNVNLGNLQRIWKEIEEDSTQLHANLELPFDQWDEERGYFKTGIYDDRVERSFDQDSFSNFGDAGASFFGDWDEPWSAVFPDDIVAHPISESLYDVDYEGEQNISAWYAMADLPLSPTVKLVGGARFESTEISIVNDPEAFAVYYDVDADISTQPIALTPGAADVDFEQDDVLPSLGLEYRPVEEWTFRAAYSQTVARQTFKELSPIQQQEYLGADIFIGNPNLGMSALENFDLRVDYAPYQGSLVSLSLFHKEIEDPIEYVQKVGLFTYTSAVNYPEGRLSGIELEVRQQLGRFWPEVEGLSVGANATFIESEVTLPDDEAALFSQPVISAPMSERDMTNAPEHLYNLYVTYDYAPTATQLALFYTVKGDTLVTGAGIEEPNWVPNVYEKEFGTLNFSLSQKLGERWQLQLQAKNLTNPDIEEVYRSEYIDGDVTKTSYTKGIEFSVGLTLSL
jgi:TonB-dependent receptor